MLLVTYLLILNYTNLKFSEHIKLIKKAYVVYKYVSFEMLCQSLYPILVLLNPSLPLNLEFPMSDFRIHTRPVS